MQKQAKRAIALIAVTAVALMLASPVAQAGPWTVPNGSTDSFGGPLDFSYSNGGDINGLFGDPFIFGDAFSFTTAFQVAASNGGQQSESDTVSVDVLADPGLKFSSVSVVASGSYLIDTEGSVDVGASLSMSENTGLLRTFSDSLTSNVAFPITVPSSGNFNGSALVNVDFVFPTPSDDINISLSNNILAIAGPMGTATVNIQFQDLSISFGVIPEPASASLVLVGFLALVRRRRTRLSF